MSKRVVIGAFNFAPPDEPEISSCWSGQFTPFLEGPPPARNPGFPVTWVQMSLEKIDRIFHRTKLIAGDTDGFVSAGGSNDSFPNGELAGGAVKSVTAGLNRMDDERDHATRVSSDGPAIIVAEITGGGNFQAWFFVDQVHFSPVIYREIVDEEPVYWVPVLIIGNMFVGISPNTAELVISSDALSISGPTGSIVATIDTDILVPVFFKTATAGDGTATFSRLDLTILKFWEYAYLNGDPVWDENTGERLEPERAPET